MRGAAAALALWAAAAAAAGAEPRPCPGTGITVEADPALAPRICRVASETAERLSRCGLPLSGPVEIRVVAALPEACTGLYHCGARRIDVLAPGALETARRSDTAFATIPAPAYFDSLIAHEIAHAAHDAVPCPFGTCEVTGEYVAYTAQIAALPEADRAAFLAAAGVAAANRADLSLVLLKLDPARFAASAVRHLDARGDPCAYLAAIGRGDIVLDRQRP
ncbi:hypothetical protein DLJ49_16240 [Rhodovulum sp. 12E13]|uniref:DUF6639 family protein n=1 Tax=Rhodovulum sp. 12E13 TaxID=2203891 RepID=UPI000E16947B|nr:DUF6639 family protein [Rhodovulum sp. 12E13]RDC71077.1 hypothetical protein DLJ49_16240 [Rhodovulum sp. 12E13]